MALGLMEFPHPSKAVRNDPEIRAYGSRTLSESSCFWREVIRTDTTFDHGEKTDKSSKPKTLKYEAQHPRP